MYCFFWNVLVYCIMLAVFQPFLRAKLNHLQPATSLLFKHWRFSRWVMAIYFLYIQPKWLFNKWIILHIQQNMIFYLRNMNYIRPFIFMTSIFFTIYLLLELFNSKTGPFKHPTGFFSCVCAFPSRFFSVYLVVRLFLSSLRQFNSISYKLGHLSLHNDLLFSCMKLKLSFIYSQPFYTT